MPSGYSLTAPRKGSPRLQKYNEADDEWYSFGGGKGTHTDYDEELDEVVTYFSASPCPSCGGTEGWSESDGRTHHWCGHNADIETICGDCHSPITAKNPGISAIMDPIMKPHVKAMREAKGLKDHHPSGCLQCVEQHRISGKLPWTTDQQAYGYDYDPNAHWRLEDLPKNGDDDFTASRDVFEVVWDIIQKGYDFDNPDIYSVYHDLMNQKPKFENVDDVVGASLFSGGGGADLGFEMAGIPTVMGVEAEDAPLRAFKQNFPKAATMQTWLGEGDEGSVETMADHIEGVADGRPLHVQGSPPCVHSSNALPAHLRNESKTMDLQDWQYRLVDALEPRFKEGDLTSSVENVPRVKKLTSSNISGNTPPRWQEMAARAKPIRAGDMGSAQARNRFITGTGWDDKDIERPNKGPQTYSNYNSILDYLPHFEEEEKEIKGYKEEQLGRVLNQGNITQEQFNEIMSKPQLHTDSAINVGNRGGKGRTWNALRPMDKHTASLTGSNRPTHAWNRPLTNEEILMLGNFPLDYDLSGLNNQQAQKIVGNAVNPLAARSIGNAVLGRRAGRRVA
tara:strand:+ start:76 stop:1770 length:1695 start_codon:yes stop_codon:yes gene_type:complete